MSVHYPNRFSSSSQNSLISHQRTSSRSLTTSVFPYREASCRAVPDLVVLLMSMPAFSSSLKQTNTHTETQCNQRWVAEMHNCRVKKTLSMMTGETGTLQRSSIASSATPSSKPSYIGKTTFPLSLSFLSAELLHLLIACRTYPGRVVLIQWI